MYGKKRYRPLTRKPSEVATVTVNPAAPSFICTRCKVIKHLANGYVDIILTEAKKDNICYRICVGCLELLKTWMKR